MPPSFYPVYRKPPIFEAALLNAACIHSPTNIAVGCYGTGIGIDVDLSGLSDGAEIKSGDALASVRSFDDLTGYEAFTTWTAHNRDPFVFPGRDVTAQYSIKNDGLVKSAGDDESGHVLLVLFNDLT